jgi:hypothetical protein
MPGGRSCPQPSDLGGPKGIPMLDIAVLGLGTGLFALMLAYVAACERM